MHAAAVPIEIPKWFAMPIDRYTIFFPNSFQQVTGNPNLVSGFFGAF